MGATGRDAPPGPGAAPWLLLALAAAALRAPPALGLHAGEQRKGAALVGRRELSFHSLDPGFCNRATDWSWGLENKELQKEASTVAYGLQVRAMAENQLGD